MAWWSQPIRVEQPDSTMLCTSRTVNSALWYVNNPELEYRVLAYLAKYQEKYGVILYAFVLQGNHYHLNGRFPRGNRSAFFRDFNARVAEAVRELVPDFLGGPLVERRYTPQTLPLDSDIEDYFFYCALQPVSAGLTERISDYPGYNPFSDAVKGVARKFKLVNRAEFNARRRTRRDVDVKDYTEEYTLTYSRLPGYDDLSPREYQELMHKRLEERRRKLVREHLKEGKRFPTRKELKKVRPGALPHSTKKGGLRPLVLTKCREARQAFLDWYLGVVRQYRGASLRYLSGDEDAYFPPGTYKPPGPLVAVV